jgi:hypothetical protein
LRSSSPLSFSSINLTGDVRSGERARGPGDLPLSASLIPPGVLSQIPGPDVVTITKIASALQELVMDWRLCLG